MKKTKQQLRRKADRIWGGKILKEGRCLVCDKRATDPHHFFPKGRCSALRYDLDNGVALCRSCHIKHHWASDPSIIATIIKKKGRDWYEKLEKKFKKYQKKPSNSYLTAKYYEEIITRLTKKP